MLGLLVPLVVAIRVLLNALLHELFLFLLNLLQLRVERLDRLLQVHLLLLQLLQSLL